MQKLRFYVVKAYLSERESLASAAAKMRQENMEKKIFRIIYIYYE